MSIAQAITSTVLVTGGKQVKIFQVKLPRHTKRILGVEIGMRWVYGMLPPQVGKISYAPVPMKITRSTLVGDLRLQTCERSNTFYSGELRMGRNLDFGDFSSQLFKPREYSHTGNQYEEVVGTGGESPMLQGIYRDRLYEVYNREFKYLVSIYVWIEPRREEAQP